MSADMKTTGETLRGPGAVQKWNILIIDLKACLRYCRVVYCKDQGEHDEVEKTRLGRRVVEFESCTVDN